MLDPSADFAQVIDAAEAVTLLRRGSDPGAPGTTVAHALRRAIAAAEAGVVNRNDVKKRMPSNGQYMASDVAWHLPAAELPEAPRLGDVILDAAGQRWTILEVKQVTLGARWRCGARNLAVAHGLDHTITVLKAVYAKGSCGAAEAAWRTWKTGVRARIQPAEVKVETSGYARQIAARFRIFVADDLDLDQTHRILGPDGTAYRIVGSLGAERIGELQVIEAEVTR